MNNERLNNQYEVLSPWAAVDPLPPRTISPRVSDLAGKTIGLFDDLKPAAQLMLTVVENRLKEKFPTASFSWFRIRHGYLEEEASDEDRARFEQWVKGVDTVAAAVGD